MTSRLKPALTTLCLASAMGLSCAHAQTPPDNKLLQISPIPATKPASKPVAIETDQSQAQQASEAQPWNRTSAITATTTTTTTTTKRVPAPTTQPKTTTLNDTRHPTGHRTNETRSNCQYSVYDGQIPQLVNPRLKTNTALLCYPSYAFMYSGVSHSPLWAAAEIPNQPSRPYKSKPPALHFHDDRGPLKGFTRNHLSSYIDSHFTAYPLIPPDKAPTPAGRYDRSNLGNAVPLNPAVATGIWHAIDNAIETLAQTKGPIYIVSGPDYHGSQIDSIEPGNILIPTSIWTAIFAPKSNETGVYVCTNRSVPACHIVSVKDITDETGIDPFPAVPTSEKITAMKLPEPNT